LKKNKESWCGIYSSEVVDDYWEDLFSFYRGLFEVKRRFSFEAIRKKMLANNIDSVHEEIKKRCF